MADSSRDFSQQPIVTIASGTSTNVITDSTHCLQRCVQAQLGYLDKRARALASCAHFEAALRDAITMQELAPTLAAGYLCAGHVYSMQGRQYAAIDIYDQGLAAIPLSDPSRQQLVDARSMAQEKDRKRVDLIKDFPLDIIEHIAPWILTEEEIAPNELEEYLGVSRVWREKLLLGAQELHIEGRTDDDLGDNNDLLEQVAPYCTALTLKRNTNGFTRFKPKAPFKSLHTLTLCGATDYTAELSQETLASLTSLTHLTITAHENNLTLGDILNSCPKLVYLRTHFIDEDMSTAPECHSRLKSLLLWEHNAKLDIPAITKRLPGLEVFVANPFYYSEHLNVVQDNCPNLKMIGCNNNNRYQHASTVCSNDPHDTVGVHTFVIDYAEGLDLFFKTSHVMNFMIRNRNTLQGIYFWTPLRCGDIEDNPSGIPLLSSAIQATANDNHHDQFNQLTSYTQFVFLQDDLLMARWIARKSPHLKEFKLDRGPVLRSTKYNISALFDDLIGLCELEAVKLFLDSKHSMDMGGIERFIRYHSTFDSQLHTLILPNDIRLHHDTLNLLVTLPRLKHLSISFPLVQDEDDDLDGEHFSQFIHQLAVECPRLEYLKIVFLYAIPDKTLLLLSELQVKSLELKLPQLVWLLPEGLVSLLQCPQLRELHIQYYGARVNPTSDIIRNMLKSTIDIVTERDFSTDGLW